MQLTLQSDYAFRLLIYLRAGNRRANVSEIAAAYGISQNHLAKVAQVLVQAGWLESKRGRDGGLTLTQEASDDLTLGDILRETESNCRLVECFEANGDCAIEPTCGLKGVLREALDAFFGVLDNYTLGDLVKRPKQVRQLLQIGAPE